MQESWNKLTPSYFFVADDETKEDMGTDPRQIIMSLVKKYEVRVPEKAFPTAHFAPVKDKLTHGFGVVFSELDSDGAYSWIEVGWFEEGFLVNGQRIDGDFVEEGFFDKTDNGALSRGLESAFVGTNSIDMNIKKD